MQGNAVAVVFGSLQCACHLHISLHGRFRSAATLCYLYTRLIAFVCVPSGEHDAKITPLETQPGDTVTD